MGNVTQACTFRDGDPEGTPFDDGTLSSCFSARSESGQPATGPGAPLLVLNFDVNKTVVMSDVAQKKSTDEILGEVLAHSVWGHIEEGFFTSEWKYDEKGPLSSAPHPSAVSFYGWLKQSGYDQLSRKDKMRELGRGTEGESPGLAQARRELEAALQIPQERLADYKSMFQLGTLPAEQQYRYIVPAFFRCVIGLAKLRRQFVVVFRTFGKDIDKGLLNEVNAFAEGKHPLYPDVGPFNGTNGRPDLRISLDDPTSHGSFYRDAGGDHLVLGTLERPPPDEKVSSVGIEYFEGKENIKIVSGHRVISAHLAKMYTQRGALALRDYWPFWDAKNESSNSGKLLYIDLADTAVHPIIFDDHIGPKESRIIDARDMAGDPIAFDDVSGVHLVRCEPLDCLSDDEYFLSWIKACEGRRRSSAGMSSPLLQNS